MKSFIDHGVLSVVPRKFSALSWLDGLLRSLPDVFFFP